MGDIKHLENPLFQSCEKKTVHLLYKVKTFEFSARFVTVIILEFPLSMPK